MSRRVARRFQQETVPNTKVTDINLNFFGWICPGYREDPWGNSTPGKPWEETIGRCCPPDRDIRRISDVLAGEIN